MKWMALLCCALASASTQSDIVTWTVAGAPMLSIGGDGSPATEFSRIEGAVRLSNGRIAVVNEATKEIRLFDARGTYLTTYGRSGAGPSEFQSLGLVGHAGDTVFAFDGRLRRITVAELGAKPRLLNTIRVTATGNRGTFYVSHRLTDGRWLVATYTTPRFDVPPGVNRSSGSIGIIAPAADGEVTWLGAFKSLALFVHSPTGDLKGASVGPIAFGPGLHAVAVGNTVWVGDSNVDSLYRFAGGARTVHVPFVRRRPSTAAVDAARERELSTARDDRSRSWVAAKYSDKYLPAQVPFFGALVPGSRGELWIQEYREDPTSAARYLVLDSEGRARARVTVPAGVRVTEVGDDYVLGIHEDDDGVESVQLYRLSRSER